MTGTELKAQINSQITNETTSNSISPADVGGNMSTVVSYVEQEIISSDYYTNAVALDTLSSANAYTDSVAIDTLASANAYTDQNSGSSGDQVFNNLFATGIAGQLSTTNLNYGLNIVIYSIAANFAAKLPIAEPGKTVKVVNTSDYPVAIYPNEISGIVNDKAFAVVPNNKIVYEFMCDNADEFGYTWRTVSEENKKIEFAEIYIDHVSGTQDEVRGISQAGIAPFQTISLDASKNLVLNNEWITEENQSTLISAACYTNIVEADVSPSASSIIFTVAQVSKTSLNNFSLQYPISVNFQRAAAYTGSYSSIGTLHTPTLIGDTSTLFYKDTANFIPFAQIGDGKTFSRNFYSFQITIPADLPTKTYRFKVLLEYV